jgi:hypothetical protein
MYAQDKPQEASGSTSAATSGASAPRGVVFSDAEKLRIEEDARKRATGCYIPHR